MKRAISILLALVLALACVSAFAGGMAQVPSFVFMFIGDGMGGAQVTAARYYLGAIENPDAAVPAPAQLSFTGWKNVGLMTTFNAELALPDSASSATAMATGVKTLWGAINYRAASDADGELQLTDPAKIITEYAREAGKKIGVISSVPLNQATPAAYYAKVKNRYDYYEIGVQALTGATLDFLGGGNLHRMYANGQPGTKALAEENGWTIVNTLDGFKSITAGQAPVLFNNPDITDSDAMAYEIDRIRRTGEGEDILSLADIVKAGITVLDNKDGFFMMVEGGKIDWACHANDAAASILDTVAFSDAVQVAVDFAAAHEGEVLIVVTGDHETGGMTLGMASGANDTHLEYLRSQTISFQMFSAMVAKMRGSGSSFTEALAQIETCYGLTAKPDMPLTLTADELAALQAAYDLSMTPAADRDIGDAERLLYGGYEPLSIAVSHIIGNKAGVSFASYGHSGLQIPVYAFGVNAELFNGTYDNTDIFFRTMDAMGLTVSE